MKINRRSFTKKSLAITVGAPIIGTTLAQCNSSSEQSDSSSNVQASNPLDILILGGTSFLGPHLVHRALTNGHKITTFTRGRTTPTIHQSLFENVESLIGDRSNDLSALEGRKWDVVIDNSGHNVAWAKKSANLLKDQVNLYLFTSSTGVYYPYLEEDISEKTNLLTEEPEGIEDELEKIEYWYGVMKTNSEKEVKKALGPERSLLIRPTYMIGPGDKSDRFIHWPIRLSEGGPVLVPGKTDDPVQYIDVRDVADFMIRLIESNTSGTYNAVGPVSQQTMSDFVTEAAQVFNTDHEFIQVSDYEFLLNKEVFDLVPWIMPVDNNFGSARINNEKGIKAGLTFRDLKTTVKDTFDWWNSDALTQERRDQFMKNADSVLAKEEELLEEWRQIEKSKSL